MSPALAFDIACSGFLDPQIAEVTPLVYSVQAIDNCVALNLLSLIHSLKRLKISPPFSKCSFSKV